MQSQNINFRKLLSFWIVIHLYFSLIYWCIWPFDYFLLALGFWPPLDFFTTFSLSFPLQLLWFLSRQSFGSFAILGQWGQSLALIVEWYWLSAGALACQVLTCLPNNDSYRRSGRSLLYIASPSPAGTSSSIYDSETLPHNNVKSQRFSKDKKARIPMGNFILFCHELGNTLDFCMVCICTRANRSQPSNWAKWLL